MRLCQISHWFHVSIGSFVVVSDKNKNLHYLSDLYNHLLLTTKSKKKNPVPKKASRILTDRATFHQVFVVCVCACVPVHLGKS